LRSAICACWVIRLGRVAHAAARGASDDVLKISDQGVRKQVGDPLRAPVPSFYRKSLAPLDSPVGAKVGHGYQLLLLTLERKSLIIR
jgi:hypothetical protein